MRELGASLARDGDGIQSPGRRRGSVQVVHVFRPVHFIGQRQHRLGSKGNDEAGDLKKTNFFRRQSEFS